MTPVARSRFSNCASNLSMTAVIFSTFMDCMTESMDDTMPDMSLVSVFIFTAVFTRCATASMRDERRRSAGTAADAGLHGRQYASDGGEKGPMWREVRTRLTVERLVLVSDGGLRIDASALHVVGLRDSRTGPLRSAQLPSAMQWKEVRRGREAVTSMAFLHLSLLAAAFCSHFLLSRTNCLAVNFRLNKSNTPQRRGRGGDVRSSSAGRRARSAQGRRWHEG